MRLKRPRYYLRSAIILVRLCIVCICITRHACPLNGRIAIEVIDEYATVTQIRNLGDLVAKCVQGLVLGICSIGAIVVHGIVQMSGLF